MPARSRLVTALAALRARPVRRAADLGPAAERRARWRARAASGVAIALAAVTAVAVPTAAFWTEQVTATSGSFRAGVVPAVGTLACTDAAAGVEIGWVTVGDRFRYRAVLWNRSAATAAGSPVALEASGTGTNAAAVLGLAAFGLTAADPAARYEIRVVAVAPGGVWTSASHAATAVHATDPGRLRCGDDTATAVQITAISADSFPSGMQQAYGADFITSVAGQTISGTGEPGARVELRRGGTLLGTATVGAGGAWAVPGVTLVAGAASYVATAVDPVGNAASDDQTIQLDQAPPTVTQAAPCPAANVGNPVAGVAGAAWCRVTSLPWSLTAADSGSGIVPALTRFNDNGAGWVTGTSATLAQDSARVVQATATDVAGNTTTVSSTYYIDGTAPTVTESYPSNGLSVAGSLLVQLVGTTCGTGSVACGTIADAHSGPAASGSYTLRRSALLAAPCFTGTGYTNAATCPSLPVSIANGQWRAQGTTSAAYPLGLAQTFTFVLTVSDAAGNQTTRTITWTAVL